MADGEDREGESKISDPHPSQPLQRLSAQVESENGGHSAVWKQNTGPTDNRQPTKGPPCKEGSCQCTGADTDGCPDTEKSLSHRKNDSGSYDTPLNCLSVSGSSASASEQDINPGAAITILVSNGECCH